MVVGVSFRHNANKTHFGCLCEPTLGRQSAMVWDWPVRRLMTEQERHI